MALEQGVTQEASGARPAMGLPVPGVHPAARRPDALLLTVVAGLGLLTLAFVFAGNGDLGLALVPLALALVVLGVVRAPLRYSLLALGVVCLIADSPGEVFAGNLWESPLYP